MSDKPLLLVDIDGVISLWGFASDTRPDGTWCQVDGIAHFLSARAGAHLLDLAADFELVWCSGWEEKANEHLPHQLGLPRLHHLTFGQDSPTHWKLAAIDAYAGADRELAWIDDDLNEACDAWAARRPARTLLIHSDPAIGLDDGAVARLRAWAAEAARPSA